MSPRRYRMGQRNAATERTRAQVLAGVRELLAHPRGFSELSMDAVARKSGVARMTVYYQFGSKAGLLEALYEHLLARVTAHNSSMRCAIRIRWRPFWNSSLYLFACGIRIVS